MSRIHLRAICPSLLLILAVFCISAPSIAKPFGASPAYSAGEYHNLVLYQLQTTYPMPGSRGLLSADEYREMLLAGADYMVGSLGADPGLTGRIADAIEALSDSAHLRHAGTDTDFIYFHDIGNLLAMATALPSRTRISQSLSGALHDLYYEALFRERIGEDPQLDQLVQALIDRRWQRKDRAFVALFAEVYRASSEYWGGDDGTGQERRRKWITILADAIGGAIGGAAGAAAGGPVGAGIGAGLLGAAASHVFSDVE